MPLDDSSISREPDGSFNEACCTWCYVDGQFIYHDLDALINFLTDPMASETWPAEAVRKHLSAQLPKLDDWQKK